MNNLKRYAIACRTPWFWELWDEQKLSGEWLEIHSDEELQFTKLKEFNPAYIFFPHWSHIVGDEILEHFECVCFHSAPVPFGRGGSPVQNMIVRGFDETELVALQMTEILDGGPVYCREEVSLLGSAEEIYIRLSNQIIEMIQYICDEGPKPEPQEGEITVFKRRKPHESEIPPEATLREVFDYIRMLDAEGYPKAFIEYGDFRLEFSRAAQRRDHIKADVKIRSRSDSEKK